MRTLSSERCAASHSVLISASAVAEVMSQVISSCRKPDKCRQRDKRSGGTGLGQVACELGGKRKARARARLVVLALLRPGTVGHEFELGDLDRGAVGYRHLGELDLAV